VVENESVKRNLITSIAPLLQHPETTIFATNTSSISITRLAAFHSHPANFIGMHFMNPVPVMQLVELINGCETAKQTLSITQSLVAAMGKVSTLSEDVPGFIANRILMPYINEAIFTLYEV
jgi:3-hydroxybutyryl-CoA dehydrogenase